MTFRAKVVQMPYTQLDSPHILTITMATVYEKNIYQPQNQLSDKGD